MKRYDYLIVGSGLYGAVFAQQAQKKGKKVLVIDKRPILQEMSTQKTSKRFTCTNMEPIFSIQTIRRYGIISHNLLNSTDSQTHQ